MITRKLAIIAACVVLSQLAHGQDYNSVGINTVSPNSKAVLHLVSPNNDQGLLIPSLSSAQRLQMKLTDEENGLLVYDNETGTFHYWHNDKWNSLKPSLSNELQNLSFDGKNLSITQGNSIDVSDWDTDKNDDFNGDYNSLLNKPTIPTTTNELTNNSGFITSPDDADADDSNEIQDLQFSASQLTLTGDPDATVVDFSAWDQNAADDFDGDYNSLLNKPTIPTTTNELTNNSGFITSPDDADADASNEIQNLQFSASQLNLTGDPDATVVDFSAWDQNAADDFDGDYNSLLNKPTIPTTTNELTNNSGFITSPDDADADASNEIQNLQFSASQLNLTGDPDATVVDFSAWDQNAADDFDGDYNSLLNKPTIPTTTNELTNNSGFITSPNDADADASNEIQDLQFSANQLTLTGDPDATVVDFSAWDQNAADDFNGDYNSLLNKPTIPTTTNELTNNSGFITSPDDADADASNEIQDLQFSASQLTLTGDPDATVVDFSVWDQNAADDFDGDYNSLLNKPAIPTTTNELTNNSGFITSPDDADADASNEIQDLQFSASQLTLTGDPDATVVDFSAWDQNAADDFNGDYNSLLNKPTIPTTTNELTNNSGFITSPNDADADASNEIQDLQFSASQLTLTGDPDATVVDFSAWDQNAADDFNGDYNSLTNKPTIPTTTNELTNNSGFITNPDDADADASNEIQNLQFSASQLTLTGDPDATVVDFSAWDQNAADDFDGDYNSLLNKPTIPTTTNELTNNSGFITSPDDADADASNEIQNLQFSASQLTLTGDPDATVVDFSAWDQNAADDFDGDYNSLLNKPTIPTTTNELTNNSGFITSPNDADADASNEIQDLQFSASQLTLTGDPDATVVDFSAWDQNAADDFNGDYNSLLNKPTIPTTTSELTNNSGFITSPDDADADASNEIQDLQFSASQLTLTGDPDATVVDFSAWDQNAADDFDGDYNSLLNKPTIPTTTNELTNNSGFITSPDDADADASNEIQNLQFSASQLTLTGDPDATVVDFSAWDQNAADDFDGDYNSLLNKPTIPTTTNELTNNSGFITSPNDADADASNEIQDLQFSASQLTLTGDPDATVVDFSAWDQNAADDFNGDYNSLLNKPTLGTLAALNTVNTAQLTNGAVTESKLNASVAGAGLSGGAGSPLSVALAAAGGLQLDGANEVEIADVTTGTTYTILAGGSITYNNKGQITSTGTSDGRLKKDTVNLTNVLPALRKVKGYTYYWKDKNLPGIQYGFVAQQIEQAFPDLVMTNSSGIKSVNYNGVIPVLVEALKEQAEKIDLLETQLSEESQKNSDYENRLQELESSVNHLLKLIPAR